MKVRGPRGARALRGGDRLEVVGVVADRRAADAHGDAVGAGLGAGTGLAAAHVAEVAEFVPQERDEVLAGQRERAAQTRAEGELSSETGDGALRIAGARAGGRGSAIGWAAWPVRRMSRMC